MIKETNINIFTLVRTLHLISVPPYYSVLLHQLQHDQLQMQHKGRAKRKKERKKFNQNKNKSQYKLHNYAKQKTNIFAEDY
jgi:hypothetical protein